MNNSIERLAELLSELPGIGPRQSKRIVYFLLSRKREFLAELSRLIAGLTDEISECTSCHRFFQKNAADTAFCAICGDPHRDRSLLMVVARDTDLDSMEKSRSYKGLYFVLGGTVPIMEEHPEKLVRERELKNYIDKHASGAAGIKEIIFALNANPEGENTQDYLTGKLAPQKEKFSLKFSVLGRGLSSGSELEYADKHTLQNALENRR